MPPLMNLLLPKLVYAGEVWEGMFAKQSLEKYGKGTRSSQISCRRSMGKELEIRKTVRSKIQRTAAGKNTMILLYD